MKNRLPTKPGRAFIIPENAMSPFFATVHRADEPTEEGTPLNKATLLTDETAAVYGLGEDAVPDEVLAEIYNRMQWKCVENQSFTVASDTRPFTKTINLNVDLRQYNEFIVVLAQKSNAQNDTSSNKFFAFIDDDIVSLMLIKYNSSKWTYETSLPIAVLKLSDNECVIGNAYKEIPESFSFGTVRTTAPKNLTLSSREQYLWMRAGEYKVLIFARGKR